ncbi:hypothetical protein C488_01996 [Natrinema pellirubrum DSM 15624]|uniref:Uncharacterized protein n=1 Tax=Natrinema pellirubrum (strain DSM 15624 / CIP 106293 / JCM 10476 / NCIMB 786 / 157) TaxID=797303 RepID=L9Z7B0_NATP1|nr:hypothetical protein C488_01996 [Natrinema pellirubrum DSM 15624]
MCTTSGRFEPFLLSFHDVLFSTSGGTDCKAAVDTIGTAVKAQEVVVASISGCNDVVRTLTTLIQSNVNVVDRVVVRVSDFNFNRTTVGSTDSEALRCGRSIQRVLVLD